MLMCTPMSGQCMKFIWPVKKTITTAKPWTAMTAYNRVNGEYAANNKYLLDLLRHEWGYQGMVVSDWTGIDDIIASLKTGLNLEMPGNQKITPQTVIDAIKAGRLTEAELDAAIAPIIALADKAHQTTQTAPVDLAQQAKSAYEIASETAVLLKNEQNILPINADDNVLFVGAMLDKPRFQGGGSSHINAKYLTDI